MKDRNFYLAILFAFLSTLLVPKTAFPLGLQCPEGAYLVGGVPPAATSWGCERIGAGGEPVRHGWWTEWYLNGQKRQEGRYFEGEKVGKWTWWYSTGIKMQEGTYLGGMPYGSWSFWSSTGTPIEVKGKQVPVVTKATRIEFDDFARNLRREFKH